MNQFDPKNKTTCHLCGSINTKLFIKELWQCSDCSFCFIPLSKADENKISGRYISNQVSTVEYYQSLIETEKKNFVERLKLIENFVSPGQLLDVGSNIGTFSGSAKERGWQVTAVEPNATAVQISREQGINTIENFFSANLPELKNRSSFDCVVMNDVIEHVADPVVMLKDAWQILKASGIVAITTPNIDHPFCRRYQIKPAEHLVYFNQKTLRVALEKAGFEVLFCQSVSRYRNVAVAAKNPTASFSFPDKIISSMARAEWINKILAHLLKKIIKDEIFAIGRKV
ncbi:MAG: class I SAM-dependent methyltransferase [Candidatus Uhrbacteria bacterium]